MTSAGRRLAPQVLRAPAAARNLVPRAWRDALRHRVGPFAPWEAGFDHCSPPPWPGAVTAPPDFVGIGAQKAGTTWWFGLVLAHPDVSHHPAIHKERHYFASYGFAPFGPADQAGYAAWFPRRPGTITGEWTPDYLHQPWVPPLLARCAPETRLLVILRDPVERLRSGLAHEQLAPAAHLGSAVTEAVERGRYAEALRRWQATGLPLLVLQYERCVADPAGQLARTYRFLGLDDSFRPADLARAASPTRRPKVALSDDARRRLVALYAEDVAETARLVPDLDRRAWANFPPD